MVYIIGILLLILLIGGPLALIPGVFVLAHRLGKRFDIVGRLISISWIVGILGLIPGWASVTHYQSEACFICFETTTETRGWPFSWLGFNGFGNLLVPLLVLGNIVTISLTYALAALLLTSLTKRWLSDSTTKTWIAILAFVIALLPFWGGTIISNLINTARETQQQKNLTLRAQHLKQEINSIQLQQCSNFALVPSPIYPGIKNIQVTVLAHVNTPENYMVQADLQDKNGGFANAKIDLALGVGDQHLVFLFKPIDPTSNLRFNGPCTIVFYVPMLGQDGEEELGLISVLNSGSTKNLILDCLTPPYTLDDLGVSKFPLPTP